MQIKLFKRTDLAVHSKLIGASLGAFLFLGFIFICGCGSSVSVGDNNGDNRDNVTNIIEPNETPQSMLPPIAIGGENPVCTEIQSPFDGFKVRFTYKPFSDSDGNAVALLPAAFSQRAESVELVYQGEVIDSGRWANFGNADGEGRRQHWRFSMPGDQYVTEDDPQMIVRVTSSNGICEWGLDDARVRQD